MARANEKQKSRLVLAQRLRRGGDCGPLAYCLTTNAFVLHSDSVVEYDARKFEPKIAPRRPATKAWQPWPT